jgi:hypothetical protein
LGAFIGDHFHQTLWVNYMAGVHIKIIQAKDEEFFLTNYEELDKLFV